MKNIIITGATGMVGKLVLQQCLASAEISNVTAIVRKSAGVMHNKLKEVIVKDFLDYSGMEKYFKNQHIAFYCLGVYTGSVPKDEFKKITFDYTVAFAELLKKESPEAVFCFLSGEGADQEEKSRMAFAKYKGMAENFLKGQNFGRLHIFRPGYIYPVTPRKEPNFSYVITRKLYPLLKKISPGSVITSEQLAKTIFTVGLKGGPKGVIKNKNIRSLSVT